MIVVRIKVRTWKREKVTYGTSVTARKRGTNVRDYCEMCFVCLVAALPALTY